MILLILLLIKLSKIEFPNKTDELELLAEEHNRHTCVQNNSGTFKKVTKPQNKWLKVRQTSSYFINLACLLWFSPVLI